jgi:hypothetical protein
MSHPLVLALFGDPTSAAKAARDLRALGLPAERVSIVARSHDEEGVLARQSGASPGSDIEDSRTAGRLGELSGHLIAAIALVLPGVGPIVADGPLAAELGEVAGHLAGGIERTLERTGLDSHTAKEWSERIHRGAVLVGAHVDEIPAEPVRDTMKRAGATHVEAGTWAD